LNKAISYTILVFFLFNSIGYYLLFEVDKYLVRKEMRLTILENRADMIVLRVKNADSNRDLQRSDKREIEYKGMLYDVLREVRQGSSTVFICFHDSKEESLFKGLNKAHFHKIYLALWDHVIKVAFPEQPVNVNNTTFSDLLFPEVFISVKSLVLPPWSPPPKLV